MENNHCQITKEALSAQNEFKVILDLLLVPQVNQEFPERRRWYGGCLTFQLPDLVPVNPNPDAGQKGFCRKVESGPNKGKLLVTVKNQGTGNASPSETRVTFSSGESHSMPTPALQAGESKDLELPHDFPRGCPPTNCEFKIEVNSDGKIRESKMDNNKAKGLCTTVIVIE